MSKIAREVAENEVKAWLDFKNIKDKKRDENQDSIDSIIDAVCDGLITIDSDFVLTQKLMFPIGSKGEITQLSFKPRMKLSTVRICTQGIKTTDSLGFAGGYISAATGEDRNIINSMEMDDFVLSQSVVIFFASR